MRDRIAHINVVVSMQVHRTHAFIHNCHLFVIFCSFSLHSIAAQQPFENRTGGVASRDDRNILYDGPSRELGTLPVYAQGCIHTVPVIPWVVVWWFHHWFRLHVCDS